MDDVQKQDFNTEEKSNNQKIQVIKDEFKSFDKKIENNSKFSTNHLSLKNKNGKDEREIFDYIDSCHVNEKVEENLEKLKNEINLNKNEFACDKISCIIEKVVQSSNKELAASCSSLSSTKHETIVVTSSEKHCSTKLWTQRYFKMSSFKEKRFENFLKIKNGFKIFLAYSFSTAGLCAFTLLYSFAGAILIKLIDSDIERIRSVTNQVEKEKHLFSDKFWSNIVQYNIFKEDAFKRDAVKILEDYEKFLFDMIKQNHYNEKFKGISENTIDEWPIPEALFFAVTVITTIGYGNKAPKTWQGRLFTIAYALIGIPMMLLCISNLGNIMANTFRFSYHKICCCCLTNNSNDRLVTLVEDVEAQNNENDNKKNNKENKQNQSTDLTNWHHDQKLISTKNLKSHVLSSDSHSKSFIELKSHLRNQTSVPIWLVFTLLLGYIFIGGYFFSIVKDNSIPDIFVGSYFCFITLSTIGFGDIVPGMLTNPDYENRANKNEVNYELIICCAYLFVGLAVIAMSFNLVQENIKRKFIRIGRRIGVIASPECI